MTERLDSSSVSFGRRDRSRQRSSAAEVRAALLGFGCEAVEDKDYPTSMVFPKMEDVIRGADVSRSAVYRQFPTVYDLNNAMVGELAKSDNFRTQELQDKCRVVLERVNAREFSREFTISTLGRLCIEVPRHGLIEKLSSAIGSGAALGEDLSEADRAMRAARQEHVVAVGDLLAGAHEKFGEAVADDPNRDYARTFSGLAHGFAIDRFESSDTDLRDVVFNAVADRYVQPKA